MPLLNGLAMLNWAIRYSGIIRRHPEIADPRYSVVEIGSGPFGIAQFIKRPVIGVEPNQIAPANPHLTIVPGSITNLPFDDQEIDFIVCVDVLEHISPESRRRAIDELIRICRQKVIISCPCHKWARLGEQALLDMFVRLNMPVPGWLQEHLELKLPEINDILAPIAATGYKFEVNGNETMMQHYAGIALDWLYPLAGELNAQLKTKTPEAVPITGNKWDVYYSFMFIIYKQWRLIESAPQLASTQSDLRRRVVPESIAPTIYAVYHNEFPTEHLGKIVPIYAGQSADTAASGALTDRLYGGWALPNERWSELSAIYKIWKDGPRSSVIGFCHYRRLFDFRGLIGGVSEIRQTNLGRHQFLEYADYFYDDFFLKEIHQNMLIVSRPSPVQSTIFDQYCEIHSTDDYLEILTQMGLSNTPLLPGMLAHFSTHLLYSNNLFVTSWELFRELCEHWFSNLEPFAKNVRPRDISDYQRRDIAFLSERIFDAWVRVRQQMGTEIVELPVFFLE